MDTPWGRQCDVKPSALKPLLLGVAVLLPTLAHAAGAYAGALEVLLASKEEAALAGVTNAIVVKEVPPGVTMVAPLAKRLDKTGTREAERFSAYAVVQENDDPYAKAIQQLVEHSQELERNLEALREKLARLENADREQQLRVVK